MRVLIKSGFVVIVLIGALSASLPIDAAVDVQPTRYNLSLAQDVTGRDESHLNALEPLTMLRFGTALALFAAAARRRRNRTRQNA